MKKFRYKAKNYQGEVVKGLVEARDRKLAVAALRNRELVVFDLKEAQKNFSSSILISFQRASQSDVINFTRQLSTMISAGLPLTDALISLKNQAKPAFAKILAAVINDVQGGSSFYKALFNHPQVFPPIYLALIKSGEAAGALDKVLLRLADNLEKQKEFRARAIGSLIYPAIIILGMVGVGAVMMIFVVPQLTKMFEEYGVDLPITTKILMAVSGFLQKTWPLLILFGPGGFVGLKVWLKTPWGQERFDRFILSLPLVGSLFQKMILTEVTRTLSMLAGAGVSIIESLNIVAEATGSLLYEKSLRQAALGVEKGMSLTAMISRYDFYPSIVPQMVEVGEETGKLDEVLGRLSVYFEMETEVALKALTTAIEPIMIILLGAGVGFLVLAVIMPIYTLTAQF